VHLASADGGKLLRPGGRRYVRWRRQLRLLVRADARHPGSAPPPTDRQRSSAPASS